VSSDALVCAFERTVAQRPDAVLVASPERRTTAAELDALARAAGRTLASCLRPGALIGFSAPNGPAFLAGLLALLRADVRPVLLDAGTTPTECDRILARLGASGSVRATAAWPGSAEDFAHVDLPGRSAHEGHALVKLSSGSSGEVRGVLTPVESLLADVEAIHSGMGLVDDDVYLGHVPFSHSYGLAHLAVPALTRGVRLAVPASRAPFEGVRAVRALGVTVIPTVPGFLQALLRVALPPPLPRTVRLVLTAGAPLAPETASRFRQVYGRGVHVFYGASECGGITFDPEGTAGERGTVGRPLPGVHVDFAGPAGYEEIEVRSPAVAAGYLPEPDPRLGSGVFRTGDLGRRDGEEIRLSGRTDDLLNLRGKKVHPAEIERVLGQLPGVEDVVALGVPATERSEPLLRVVVACPPGRLRQEDVVAWCRAQLAEHKVPRSVILLPALPRNARGKVDRAALRSL
jgi:long-chain acyl-CoA synthetase